PLATLELRPMVVDAHEVRLKAHRPTQKSARRDAAELCEGVRRGRYRAIVHVPDAAVVRRRAILARRRHFVRVQTAPVSAVKAVLRAAGLGAVSRSLGSEVGWAKVLTAVADHPEAGHLRRPAPRAVALRRRAGRGARQGARGRGTGGLRGPDALPANDPRRG